LDYSQFRALYLLVPYVGKCVVFSKFRPVLPPRKAVSPKLALEFASPAEFPRPAGYLDLAVPFVGSFENVKDGGELRVSDLDDTNLYREEGKRVHSVLVEPTDCGQMLVSKALCDPHDDFGFQASQVGEDLAQVLKVGPFQLILNEDTVISLRNTGNDVSPIRANTHLLTFQLQFDSQLDR